MMLSIIPLFPQRSTVIFSHGRKAVNSQCAIEGGEAVEHRFRGMAGKLLPRRRGKAIAQRGGDEKLLQGHGQFARIAGRDEETGLAVADRFAYAPHVRRDDGRSRGEGLERRVGEGLPARGHRENG